MKTAIKPREAPGRERSYTEPKAEEASWVERGLTRARRSLPEAVMAPRWAEGHGRLDYPIAPAQFHVVYPGCASAIGTRPGEFLDNPARISGFGLGHRDDHRTSRRVPALVPSRCFGRTRGDLLRSGFVLDPPPLDRH